MQVGIFQELPADGFARAALEQHVVRNYHGGASGGLQHRANVLHEIELLVRGARQKVLPVGGTIGLCLRSNSMRRRFEIARSYLFNLGPFAAIDSACPT